MIIVIEGISAAGKTTFARQFGEGVWLPEMPVKSQRPDAGAPATEHAKFWADHNANRFKMALEIEAKHGFAICDTDPMKIHYSWCMERAGFKWPDAFATAAIEVRQRIESKQLGFADLYLVKRIEPEVARAQKDGDPARKRGNFEQHLALQPHLLTWFEALCSALPGRVSFAFPEKDSLLETIKSKAPEDDPRRFDVSVFDALVEALPT